MDWREEGCAMSLEVFWECLTEVMQQPLKTDGDCRYHQPQDSSILSPASVCFVTSLCVHAAETRASTKKRQVFWTTPWEFVRKLLVLTIPLWVMLSCTPSLTSFFLDMLLSRVFVNFVVVFLAGLFLVLICYVVFVAKIGDVSWHEELPVLSELWMRLRLAVLLPRYSRAFANGWAVCETKFPLFLCTSQHLCHMVLDSDLPDLIAHIRWFCWPCVLLQHTSPKVLTFLLSQHG